MDPHLFGVQRLEITNICDRVICDIDLESERRIAEYVGCKNDVNELRSMLITKIKELKTEGHKTFCFPKELCFIPQTFTLWKKEVEEDQSVIQEIAKYLIKQKIHHLMKVFRQD